MESLPKAERVRALQTLGVWCQMELTGSAPPQTVLERLNFNSVEAMRIQLANWGAPVWITQDEEATEKPMVQEPITPKRQARSSGPLQEVPDASAAADLFSEALEGLERVVEDLEHLSLTYQGRRFAGTYEFVGTEVFLRSSFSEQGWKELCEWYGRDPDTESFYIHNQTSKHPLGASPYPPRDVVALIAAYALSDRPVEPLLEVLYPEHSQEDIEEAKALLNRTKRQGENNGLRRTAEQFAAAVYGHKVGKGAPGPSPSRDHLLACYITDRREAYIADEKIHQEIRDKGYELSKEDFDRLAKLRLRFPNT